MTLVSVLLPFWRRQEVLTKNLQRYKELYPDFPLEIIVIDDGSPEPAVIEGEFPWPVHLIRLPAKTTPKDSVVPLNIGAQFARGEYLLLTGPEIIHRAPLLDELVKTARKNDLAHVSPAVWGGWWYCHSTDMPPDAVVKRAPTPKGAALHFCAMLKRKMFWSVGGFDQNYRDGAGYSDNDFLWKLSGIGAKFTIHDDLVADHIPCPRCEWPKGAFQRNKAIFERKWQWPVTYSAAVGS